MHKIYRCAVLCLLAVGLLFATGCQDEPNPSEPNLNQGIQLPEGIEIEIGVDTQDEYDTDLVPDDTKDDNANPDNTQSDNTQSDNTQSDNTQSDNSKPDNSQPDNSQPDNNQPDNTQQEDKPLPPPGSLTYEGFYQLSPTQQDAYIESFESLSAFNKWFNEARAEYESQIPDETINGSIDLDKYNPK